MRPGLMVGPERGRYATKVERMLADAAWAEANGLSSVWIPRSPTSSGTLWLRKADGSWSVQQPHGFTALRAALAIYNTVAEGIHSILSLSSVLSLTSRDRVDYPARG